MLDYYITGAYFKGAEAIKPAFTDFTDFPACFSVMQDSLGVRPGAHMAMTFMLLDEEPIEDRDITIRYGWGGHDGQILASVLDEDGAVLNQGFVIILDVKTGKLESRRLDGRTDDDALDDAIKIILEYGNYMLAGINWGAFLLHEYAEGRLEQYFEDAINQEIH
jgi:hypothetical protein